MVDLVWVQLKARGQAQDFVEHLIRFLLHDLVKQRIAAVIHFFGTDSELDEEI